MRKYVVIALLFLTSPALADVVIRSDGGGLITQYAARYEAIRKSGQRVVIDGWCASACTLALQLPKVCVTKRAQLGFHSAYVLDIFGQHIPDPQDTRYLYTHYPRQVRKWIDQHGGLQPGIKVMGPKTARKLLPNC